MLTSRSKKEAWSANLYRIIPSSLSLSLSLHPLSPPSLLLSLSHLKLFLQLLSGAGLAIPWCQPPAEWGEGHEPDVGLRSHAGFECIISPQRERGKRYGTKWGQNEGRMKRSAPSLPTGDPVPRSGLGLALRAPGVGRLGPLV